MFIEFIGRRYDERDLLAIRQIQNGEGIRISLLVAEIASYEELAETIDTLGVTLICTRGGAEYIVSEPYSSVQARVTTGLIQDVRKYCGPVIGPLEIHDGYDSGQGLSPTLAGSISDNG